MLISSILFLSFLLSGVSCECHRCPYRHNRHNRRRNYRQRYYARREYPDYDYDYDNKYRSDYDQIGEESSSSDVSKALSDECLHCICLASSECDPAVRCHSVGPVDYYCGPYQVSRRYWKSAGSPGSSPDNSDPFEFEDCVNNIYCAIETITNYMKKHVKDCTSDGKITCKDIALIHKAGPRQCRKGWVRDTNYWTKFKDCAKVLQI